MRSESSLAVGVAEVHALGGWGYLAAVTLLWARANKMVGGAHYSHVGVFLQYNFVLRIIKVELI